jgi:sporulation protein YlmC with PRC-barrel domain
MAITSESEAVAILDDCERDPLAREAAGRYLEHHPTARLIPRLVVALQDDDEGVRRAAAEALIRLGISAWPDLLQALMDPKRAGDPRLRRGAYHVLHQNLATAESTAPLMRELHGLKGVNIAAMIEADRLYKRMSTNDAFAARAAALRREQLATQPAPNAAETWDVPVEADVKCADGLAGHSRLVIINPIRRQVTHIVVEEKGYPYNAHLVPLGMIQESTPQLIKLRCTRHELAVRKLFVVVEYLRPGLSFAAYPPAAYWPWPYYSTREPSALSLEHNPIPPGELAVYSGTQVKATDGQVGRVNELLVNPQSGHITDLVLREGHLWFQEDVTISVAQIDHIAQDTIYLKLDKRAINALPAVPVSRWLS